MRTPARGAAQETKTGHKESCGRDKGKAVAVAMKSRSRKKLARWVRGSHTHSKGEEGYLTLSTCLWPWISLRLQVSICKAMLIVQ